MNIDILNDQLSSLCFDFANFCQTNNLKLITAESCTAGLICSRLTDLPGSSTYIEGGFVTYSNAMKVSILGVHQKILDEFGAVSEQVALEMVSGALKKAYYANIGIAVTGFAGPDMYNPVGLVWIAIQKKGQRAIAQRYNFLGNREAIRLQTVIEAIKLMLNQF